MADQDGPRTAAEGGTGKSFIGDEPCDDIDNDADGSVDEGCDCAGNPRGCIGFDGAQCGWGVQWCQQGYWSGCLDVRSPYTPKRNADVTIVDIQPAPIIRNDTAAIRVVVAVVPVCFGVQVPEVEVALEASDPVMRVRGWALDDGLGADAEANDGDFTVTLPNPFGPGVAAQTLIVRAKTEINQSPKAGIGYVDLEAP